MTPHPEPDVWRTAADRINYERDLLVFGTAWRKETPIGWEYVKFEDVHIDSLEPEGGAP